VKIPDQQGKDELKKLMPQRLRGIRNGAGIDIATAESVVFESEEPKDLTVTVGQNLRAARKAARLTEEDAANHISHKKLTQVSLAEKGERMLPLHSLIKLADLYEVPLDYLVGRHDDPMADWQESNQAIIARTVKKSIANCLSIFTNSVSNHVGVAIEHHQRDRVDILRAAELAREVKLAFERFKELNKDCYEDMRGGSKLNLSIDRFLAVVEPIAQRKDKEKAMIDSLEKELSIKSPSDQQSLLEFVVNQD
jgi:transcriptional regulator with XRE-family HTH domain